MCRDDFGGRFLVRRGAAAREGWGLSSWRTSFPSATWDFAQPDEGRTWLEGEIDHPAQLTLARRALVAYAAKRWSASNGTHAVINIAFSFARCSYTSATSWSLAIILESLCGISSE